MKHFLVRWELEEEIPFYEFVIKAKSQEQAEKIAKKILKQDYPEHFEYRGDRFSCYEVTAEKLLQELTLN